MRHSLHPCWEQESDSFDGYDEHTGMKDDMMGCVTVSVGVGVHAAEGLRGNGGKDSEMKIHGVRLMGCGEVSVGIDHFGSSRRCH